MGTIAGRHTHFRLSTLLDTLAAPVLRDRPPPMPLPGGAATFLRVIFALPPRVVIPAVLVAAAGVALLALLAWRRRADLARWWKDRWQERAWRIGLVSGISMAVVGVASAGTVSWNYIQHDNGFCISCHVMSSAWQRFGQSEHRSLNCHDCHRQSIYASTRQLAIWFTTRPEDIGSHRPLGNERCVACHVTGEPETWRSIEASAGHEKHLKSKDSSLVDLTCVTCHGARVHEFSPSEKTCLTTGCHDGTKVKLGKMEAIPVHCAACHDFTRAIGTDTAHMQDSLTRALWPGKEQCLSCHAMREQLAGTLERDPHRAVCGTCHNPHKQETTAAAAETCANAGCHQGADTLSAMHVGIRSGKLEDCVSCHGAHDFKVEGQRCESCHRTPSGTQLLALATGARQTNVVSFGHAVHASVECSSCHATDGSHGRVVLHTAADCQSCHHKTAADDRCASCHSDAAFRSRTFTALRPMRIAGLAPESRKLRFEHRSHTKAACASCHRDGDAISTGRDVSCAECHDDHHRATTQCSACHDRSKSRKHTVAMHREGCAGSDCHGSRLPQLKPPLSKAVCNACHEPGFRHKSGRRCLDCHDVRDPRSAPGDDASLQGGLQ